ncbi:MAG: hypothetical protein EAX86_00200 [Candidatus Heimdallarchaeota archaeon]|nr:hypothetical protein [Candidatus Heimdallarchaeota archaeon]
MSDSDLRSASCTGCGAPLSTKPSYKLPVKCEYCDLTNYLKKTVVTPEEARIHDAEEEAETYYLIYKETQKILENFHGEMVGDEVGKVRIKMQINRYAFPLLIVLDDLPGRPYVDGPGKLREILQCDLGELNSMKNWIPGTSSIMDVLEELYERVSAVLPTDIEESPQRSKESEVLTKEKDDLIKQILTNYDTLATKKQVIVRFYSQDGEIIPFVIKRKKNYPIGIEEQYLVKFPLIRGLLEDYAKGRIDLLTTLAEIEKMLYI